MRRGCDGEFHAEPPYPFARLQFFYIRYYKYSNDISLCVCLKIHSLSAHKKDMSCLAAVHAFFRNAFSDYSFQIFLQPYYVSLLLFFADKRTDNQKEQV